MSAEFWTSYRAIGAKLKKRFFRKVNVTDARDLYGDLVASLRREGNHQYAAFCSLAVARCAQSAGNATTEAERTWEAGINCVCVCVCDGVADSCVNRL